MRVSNMARPQKIGLDYFPMDCHLDKNLKAIIRKFGAEGIGVVVGLYQHIYSEGYWIKWCSETEEDFALEMNVDEDVLSSILEFCIKREVFNSTLYNSNKILTSRGIQKRYLNVIERRKCKQLSLYNLIDVDNNPINVDINPVNDYISTQSKEKESKEKESNKKNKENKIDSSNNSNKEAINEIVDYLNSKTGKKYRSSTPDTVSKIKARLNDSYIIEDFKKVIDVKVNNWTGTEQEQYLQPSTLFSAKFEKYLNEPMSIKPQVNKPIQQSHNIANAALIAKAMEYGKIEL